MLKSRTISLIWSRQMYRWQAAATDAALFGRILPTAVSRSRFDQSRPTTRKKGCRMQYAARPASWFPFVAALRCDAAYAGCDPRVGMKLFLLPAGAYRELIIPNYLESMYLAKLPKSLHPPNNIMRELKMKLRGHGRPTAVQELTRARITDTIPPYARALTGIGLFGNSRVHLVARRGNDGVFIL